MAAPTPRIRSSETLRAVTAALRDAPCGAVIVTVPSGPVGIVTDNDVVLATALGIDVDQVFASHVMRPMPHLVRSTDAPGEVAEIMVRLGVGHVTVVDDRGEIHLASSFDVLRALQAVHEAEIASGSALSSGSRS